MQRLRHLIPFAAALALSACDQPKPTPAPSLPQSTAPASPPASPQNWLGRWAGPEGTYLDIGLAEGKYSVTIRNLDGARSFDAAAENDVLRFERDGIQESIVATDGAGTGMKWLASKSKCLRIRLGEGYCRD